MPQCLQWDAILMRARQGNVPAPRRIVHDEATWQTLLSPAQFAITRQARTESPFSSALCHLFTPGLYACVCCKTPLFDAQHKFESGTGWPSFTSALAENLLAYQVDESHGMLRVEVTCNSCDAHLGHVFPDGPHPSGLRYCINALALEKLSAATP